MGGSTYIYTLVDPRDERIHYVGKTVQPIEMRRKGHLHTARRGKGSDTGVWIRQLLSEGVEPRIELLETVPDAIQREAEVHWGYLFTGLTNNLHCLGNGSDYHSLAKWTPELDARLGIDTDEAIARDMGVERKTVSYRRNTLGILAPHEHWTRGHPPAGRKFEAKVLSPIIIAQLGTMSDYRLALIAGVSKKRIMNERHRLGIPSYAESTGNTGRYRVGNFPARWLKTGVDAEPHVLDLAA